MSQDKFATELGFAKRTVGNAERGVHPPSLALRRALDNALEKASDAQRDRFRTALGMHAGVVPCDSAATELATVARPVPPWSGTSLSFSGLRGGRRSRVNRRPSEPHDPRVGRGGLV
ncbi:MAG: helix-turn-helix domain-containing protein [Pseudonocardiaceae bacterium]